jgi:hypothetical protein
MRNRIFGAIGVIWGSGILLGGIVRPPEGEGAYAAGQMTALVFGGLLLAAGAYYLIKGGGKKAKRQPDR